MYVVNIVLTRLTHIHSYGQPKDKKKATRKITIKYLGSNDNEKDNDNDDA